MIRFIFLFFLITTSLGGFAKSPNNIEQLENKYHKWFYNVLNKEISSLIKHHEEMDHHYILGDYLLNIAGIHDIIDSYSETFKELRARNIIQDGKVNVELKVKKEHKFKILAFANALTKAVKKLSSKKEFKHIRFTYINLHYSWIAIRIDYVKNDQTIKDNKIIYKHYHNWGELRNDNELMPIEKEVLSRQLDLSSKSDRFFKGVDEFSKELNKNMHRWTKAAIFLGLVGTLPICPLNVLPLILEFHDY